MTILVLAIIAYLLFGATGVLVFAAVATTLTILGAMLSAAAGKLSHETRDVLDTPLLTLWKDSKSPRSR